MSIASLISNAVNSIIALGGGGSASLYIEDGIAHALQRVQGENWKLNLGYSFEVEGTGKLGRSFKPFPLQINPTSLEQRETPSTTIIPVQTGVIVEYQGFVTKDLVIGGTTGIQPFRSEGGVTGGANFGLSNSVIPSGIPLFGGKWSGYMEMMLLRNYFRSYLEVKKSNSYRDLRLVFRNRKDNEHWYVEPNGAGVTVSRNSTRPFLYDYSIDLKIVGKASETPKLFGGPLGKILDGIQKVENFIDDVSNTIDTFVGIVNGSTKFLENFEKNVAITVLEPFNRIAKALKALKNGETRVSALPKEFYKSAKTTIKRIRDNFADWVGRGDSRYDSTYGRIPIPSKRSFVIDDVELLKGFGYAERALNKILASDVLFIVESGDTQSLTASSDIDDAILLNSNLGASARIGSLESLNAQFNGDYIFDVPSAISQYAIEYGETIERFANRVLGDPTAANQIILLNNLDPPYISEEGEEGKNTVKSGDLLLVPTAAVDSSVTATMRKKQTARIVRGMTTIEKELGVDIRLTKDGDFAVDTQVPDIKLIAGLDNAAQALGLSVGIERGDLLYHPNKGISAQVGKSSSLTAGEISNEIETSILSDPRFLAVKELYVKRDGGTIRLGVAALIRNINRPVPLKLDVATLNP